jgi:hypothetical protein
MYEQKLQQEFDTKELSDLYIQGRKYIDGFRYNILCYDDLFIIELFERINLSHGEQEFLISSVEGKTIDLAISAAIEEIKILGGVHLEKDLVDLTNNYRVFFF